MKIIDKNKLNDIAEEMSPELLAKLFCELDSHQMAIFFNEIHNVPWINKFAFQMQYVTDSELLTDKGRYVMSVIGEYSQKIEI